MNKTVYKLYFDGMPIALFPESEFNGEVKCVIGQKVTMAARELINILSDCTEEQYVYYWKKHWQYKEPLETLED